MIGADGEKSPPLGGGTADAERTGLVRAQTTGARGRPRAAIAVIAGLGPLQNALVGFCGGTLLFGIDTTEGEASARG